MKKIIVQTESYNLWWGVHGLCSKVGWEDLRLFNEDNERLAIFCLNTKRYLRNELLEIKKEQDSEAETLIMAVEKYLVDNQCHYWYNYNEKYEEDGDYFEVPDAAPPNDQGVKPIFVDMWHPDEGIDLETIRSAVKQFAKDLLKIEVEEVEIEHSIPFEEALEVFQEHKDDLDSKIIFYDDAIAELDLIMKRLAKSISSSSEEE